MTNIEGWRNMLMAERRRVLREAARGIRARIQRDERTLELVRAELESLGNDEEG